MSVYPCTSLTLKAQTMSHPPSSPTAGQQGHFHTGRTGALSKAASETSSPSALHSGVPVWETMGKMGLHKMFRTKKEWYSLIAQNKQQGTEWKNYNRHTCPGIWTQLVQQVSSRSIAPGEWIKESVESHPESGAAPGPWVVWGLAGQGSFGARWSCFRGAQKTGCHILPTKDILENRQPAGQGWQSPKGQASRNLHPRRFKLYLCQVVCCFRERLGGWLLFYIIQALGELAALYRVSTGSFVVTFA